jgi:hypothetical protein
MENGKIERLKEHCTSAAIIQELETIPSVLVGMSFGRQWNKIINNQTGVLALCKLVISHFQQSEK